MKDYIREKIGHMCSVGKFKGQNAFEILTGFASIPQIYPISEIEYSSFEEWESYGSSKIYEIKKRDMLYNGNRRS